MENWKAVNGFEGWYEVSDKGRIRSVERTITHSCGKVQTNPSKILKPQLQKIGKGYFTVQLYKNSKHYKRYLHRLIAEHFIPNLDNKPQVNHIDGNPRNNSIDNLEWVTVSENLQHAIDNNLQVKNKPVRRINRYGDIKEYESLQAAKEDGFRTTDHISKCCKGLKETYRGYRWEFINQKV